MKTQMMKITIMILVFCATRTGLFAQQVLPKDVVITGYLKQHTASDTVMVQIHGEFGSGNTNLRVDSTITQISKDGKFSFRIGLPRPIYLSFRSKVPNRVAYDDFSNHELYQYPFEPGDSVHVEFDDLEKTIQYTGRSAIKFNAFVELAKLNYMAYSGAKATFREHPEIWFAQRKALLELALGNLKLYKPNLNVSTYALMKADIIGLHKGNLYQIFDENNMGYAMGDTLIGNRTLKVYKQVLQWDSIPGRFDDSLSHSAYYSNYLVHKAKTDRMYDSYFGKKGRTVFEYILDYPAGELRDKALLAYSVQGNVNPEPMFTLYRDKIVSPWYQDILARLEKYYGKGEPLEPATFINSSGKKVSLLDFKGKVVFIDQWFTGCTGCVNVAKIMPEIEEEFKGRKDIVFLSLSVDKDKSTWLGSISPKQKVRDSQTKRAYTHYTTKSTVYVYTGGIASEHPFIKRYNKTGSYPSLMIIDKKGRIFSSSAPRPDAVGGREKLIEALNQALLN